MNMALIVGIFGGVALLLLLTLVIAVTLGIIFNMDPNDDLHDD